MQKRIEWIDVLKGIGIIYVTFAHLNPAMPIEKHIYSFHMFLFFFISGYLFKKPCSFRSYAKKQATVLLVPFIVWDIAATLYDIAAGKDIKASITRMFILKGEMCWNAPIWFLLILFLTETVYAAIYRDNKIMQIVIPAVSLAASYLCQGLYILGALPIAVLFYWLGNMSKYFGIIERINAYKLSFAFIFGLISIIASQRNDRISVMYCYYGDFVFCLIAGVSGIFLYCIISTQLKGWIVKALSYLGHNSMIIMCFQYWLFRVFSDISIFLFDYNVWKERNTIKAFIVTVVTIVCIVALDRCAKKVFSRKINHAIGIR